MKLTTVEQVQNTVGKLSAPRDLKVIDHIDEHARRWLSYSRFAFMAFSKAGRIQLSAAGGKQSFVSSPNPQHFLVPLARLDTESIAEIDSSVGALFLVSGMDETLRINGKVADVSDGLVTVKVEECYLHCAKAFRRSEFWSPQAQQQTHDETSEFVKQSSFLALASVNSSGEVDVSPKGDPGNFLIQQEEGSIYFADRPGNRRIDSFRNIIDQPAVSIMAMIPGAEDILELQGKAELSTEKALLQRFTVQEKSPKIVTKVTPTSIRIRSSGALAASALWAAQAAPPDLVPSEMFRSHIRKSNEKSLQAKIARAVVSLPGAMEKGLASDYKKNMY